MNIAIIPARGGSRRIPGKNIRPFCGKPMLVYAIQAAWHSHIFDQIWVSTDSVEIASVAQKHGAIWHRRSAEMSRDEVGTQELTAHVIQSLWPPLHAGLRPEFACCIYPCVPMLEPRDLRRAAKIVRDPRIHYAFVVGMFYFGATAAFMEGRPLEDEDHTIQMRLDNEREIDINTEEDWIEAERRYGEIYTF